MVLLAMYDTEGNRGRVSLLESRKIVFLRSYNMWFPVCERLSECDSVIQFSRYVQESRVIKPHIHKHHSSG